MLKLVEVKAVGKYRLWLRYADGKKGEIDLSDLAGKGVFKAWAKAEVFEAVQLDESGVPVWPGEIDLCPDSLYLRLTGKSPEEVFPKIRMAKINA